MRNSKEIWTPGVLEYFSAFLLFFVANLQTPWAWSISHSICTTCLQCYLNLTALQMKIHSFPLFKKKKKTTKWLKCSWACAQVKHKNVRQLFFSCVKYVKLCKWIRLFLFRVSKYTSKLGSVQFLVIIKLLFISPRHKLLCLQDKANRKNAN